MSAYFISKTTGKISIQVGIFNNFGGDANKLREHHESFRKAYQICHKNDDIGRLTSKFEKHICLELLFNKFNENQ